jgi:hypothetical protein
VKSPSRMKNRNGSAQSLLLLLLGGMCVYAAFKLVIPYYAYKDLERTMSYWGKISVLRGDKNYSELKEKIEWVIDEHQIPLEIDEVEMEYDPVRETLTVSAEYDVFVEFPGYEYRLHFQPHAEVEADE